MDQFLRSKQVLVQPVARLVRVSEQQCQPPAILKRYHRANNSLGSTMTV